MLTGLLLRKQKHLKTFWVLLAVSVLFLISGILILFLK
jgi:hypothetical protein